MVAHLGNQWLSIVHLVVDNKPQATLSVVILHVLFTDDHYIWCDHAYQ